MFTSTGSNSIVLVIRHGGELRLRRLSDMDKPASVQVANDVTVKGLDNPQARWPCINSTAQHQLVNSTAQHQLVNSTAQHQLISPLSHPIIPMADPEENQHVLRYQYT
jgi:hypothetical protein